MTTIDPHLPRFTTAGLPQQGTQSARSSSLSKAGPGRESDPVQDAGGVHGFPAL